MADVIAQAVRGWVDSSGVKDIARGGEEGALESVWRRIMVGLAYDGSCGQAWDEA